jgi:hypothetical protein
MQKARLVLLALLVSTFLSSAVFAQDSVFPRWENRFDAAHLADHANALVADASGNTYMTGFITVNTGTPPVADQEMMTIRYDSAGHLAWRAFLSSPAHSAEGIDIKMDTEGNVYVLSALWLSRLSDGTLSGSEYVVTKNDSNGDRLWVNYHSANPGSTTENSIPAKLLIDNANHFVYAAGISTDTIQPLPAFFVEALDFDGHNVRDSEFFGLGDYSFSRQLAGIGADASGNVYFAINFSSGSTFAGNFITEYGKGLVPATIVTFTNAAIPGPITAFLVDSAGNTYVGTGTADSNQSQAQTPVSLVKFSSSGTKIWSVSESPCLVNRYEDLQLDGSGNLYAAATLNGSSATCAATDNNNGMRTTVLNPATGQTLPGGGVFHGRTDGSGSDRALALRVNSVRDIYVTGSSTDPTLPQTDITTVKFLADGELEWTERYHGSGTGDDFPTALQLSGGSVFVAGTSNGASTCTDWVNLNYVQDGGEFNVQNIHFGPVLFPFGEAEQDVTLSNTAEVPLTEISLVLSTDSSFEIGTNYCPSVLAPGASCQFEVSVIVDGISRSGTITLHDNWAGNAINPPTIQLSVSFLPNPEQ